MSSLYKNGDIVYLSPNQQDKVKYIGIINDLYHCFIPVNGCSSYVSWSDDECHQYGVPIGTIPFKIKPLVYD